MKKIIIFFGLLLLVSNISAWEIVPFDYGWQKTSQIGDDIYTSSQLIDFNGGSLCYIYVFNDTIVAPVKGSLIITCGNPITETLTSVTMKDNMSDVISYSIAVDNSGNWHACFINESSVKSIYYMKSGDNVPELITTHQLLRQCSVGYDNAGRGHVIGISSSDIIGQTHQIIEYYDVSGSWISTQIPNTWISGNSDDQHSAIYLWDGVNNRKYVIDQKRDIANSISSITICSAENYNGAWNCTGRPGQLEIYSGNKLDFPGLEGTINPLSNFVYYGFPFTSGEYNISRTTSISSNISINEATINVGGGVIVKTGLIYANNNVHYVYRDGTDTGSGTLKYGNLNISTEQDISGTVTARADITFDGSELWVLYGSEDGIMRLAHQAVSLYNISGYVYDALTNSPLSSSFISITDTISNTTYGTFTNEAGYYNIGDITTGTYDGIASKLTYASDTNNTIYVDSNTVYNYYLFPSEYNQSLIISGFKFIDYDTKLGIGNETIRFEYIEGANCQIGQFFYHTTNDLGIIQDSFISGTYEIKPMGNYKIFQNSLFIDMINRDIFQDSYEIIEMRNINETFELFGWVYENDNYDTISNAIIQVYNTEYYYNTSTNTDGYYNFSTISYGTYTIVASHPLYSNAIITDLLIEKDTFQDLLLINNTEVLVSQSGTIYDLKDGYTLEGITIALFKEERTVSGVTSSGSNGEWVLGNLTAGSYHQLFIYSELDGKPIYRHDYEEIILNWFVERFDETGIDLYIENKSSISKYSVSGKVNLTDGMNVSNAIITITCQNPSRCGWTIKTNKTNSTGHYIIEDLLSYQDYEIEVRKYGYGVYRDLFTVSDKDYILNVELLLEEKEFLIMGTLRSCTGTQEGINGAFINFYNEAGELAYLFSTENGLFSSNTIAEGEYRIEILSAGYHGLNTTLNITQNIYNIDFCINPFVNFYWLIIWVKQEDNNLLSVPFTSVELTHDDILTANYKEVSNDIGMVRFFLIPEGKYHIELYKNGYITEKDDFILSNDETKTYLLGKTVKGELEDLPDSPYEVNETSFWVYIGRYGYTIILVLLCLLVYYIVIQLTKD